MRILVCGNRKWRDESIIERELEKFPPGTIVIHGAAKGADTIGGLVAKKLGFEVINNGKGFPADWKVR